MLKRIKIENSTLRLEDKEPFLLPNDELKFEIVENCYDLSNAFITFKNGEITEHFKVTDRVITVPKTLLFPGVLNAQLDIYYKGARINKTLFLYPVKIIETESKCEIFDIVDNLERRLSALEKQHEII